MNFQQNVPNVLQFRWEGLEKIAIKITKPWPGERHRKRIQDPIASESSTPFAHFAQIDNNLHVDCAANGERKRKIGEKKVL